MNRTRPSTPFVRLRAGILTGLFAIGLASVAQAEEPAKAPATSESSEATPEPRAKDQPLPAPQPRLKVKRADRRQGPATAISLARKGCMSDPSECRCSHKDPKKSAICAPVIGHFCPDSTLKYMASKCLSLFGGVTVCKCAANSEIQTYISKEEAAAKKKSKKGKKKGKKGKGKKKGKKGSAKKSK